MKKLFFIGLSLTLFSLNYSFADCETGYACSINFLNADNIRKETEFLKELNNYFKLDINEDFMLGKITNDFDYKDMFPFSIMLNQEIEDL